jgi:hypothetical protein
MRFVSELRRIMTFAVDFTVDPRLVRAIMSGQVARGELPALLAASAV